MQLSLKILKAQPLKKAVGRGIEKFDDVLYRSVVNVTTIKCFLKDGRYGRVFRTG